MIQLASENLSRLKDAIKVVVEDALMEKTNDTAFKNPRILLQADP